MHIYIMHFAVNQMEQTITLNGHIYMVWIRFYFSTVILKNLDMDRWNGGLGSGCIQQHSYNNGQAMGFVAARLESGE